MRSAWRRTMSAAVTSDQRSQRIEEVAAARAGAGGRRRARRGRDAPAPQAAPGAPASRPRPPGLPGAGAAPDRDSRSAMNNGSSADMSQNLTSRARAPPEAPAARRPGAAPAAAAPAGAADRAAPDEPLTLQAGQALRRAARVGARQRDQARHRPVPIEHEHGAPAANVRQVSREVVLQDGYLGLLHMAMLAKLAAWPT